MSETHLLRHPLSPAPPAEAGIALVAGPRSPREPLVVHGTFRLDMRDLEELGASPTRGVTLVVTNGELFGAYTPFRDHVMFGDDLAAAPGGAIGHFNIDVFEQQGGYAAGDYHLFVSLGTRISNVIRLTVG